VGGEPSRPVEVPPVEVSVLASVRAEVERLGVAQSPTAAQAFVLAARMDTPGDSAAGMATLSRQLEALLASLRAWEQGKGSGDFLDELKDRRRLRRMEVYAREVACGGVPVDVPFEVWERTR
jgi:hypothetical protein